MIFSASISGPSIFDNDVDYGVTVARKQKRLKEDRCHMTGILDPLINEKLSLSVVFIALMTI